MIRPIRDRVVVKLLEKSETTEGGIIIPDVVNAKERNYKGTVVAAGPGHYSSQGSFVPMSEEIVPGAVVLFNKYNGSDVTVDGEDYTILSESDIMAVEESPKRRKSS